MWAIRATETWTIGGVVGGLLLLAALAALAVSAVRRVRGRR